MACLMRFSMVGTGQAYRYDGDPPCLVVLCSGAASHALHYITWSMIMIMDENTHDWRTGRHVVYELHAYIVFVTKYRRKVMTPRVAKLLEETFGEVCERFECELEEFETDKDHAHLLVAYPPKTQLSTLVMSLKTNSSKRVREQDWPEVRQALRGDHFWSPSYCIVSCGGAPLEIVREYIRDQQKPNRKYRRKTNE